MELVREKKSPNQYIKLNLEINIDENDEPNHDNVFWYGGKVASIKSSEGEYVITARGIVSCDLIAKKDYIDKNGKQINKGDLIVHVKDKNEAGVFKKEMSLYIKDDNELLDILNKNHELYELNIGNNNWFELSFYNKTGEIEYDDDMNLSSLKDAVEEVLDMIWKQNKNNPVYAIYCRVDNDQGEYMISIQNQINKCLNYINQNVKGNTELIKIYFDKCSGVINHKNTLGMVLEDIKNNNIKELFSVNLSRLSRDIKVITDIINLIKDSEIDIYLVDEKKYLYKDFYNEISIPIFQKLEQKCKLEEPELEEMEHE